MLWRLRQKRQTKTRLKTLLQPGNPAERAYRIGLTAAEFNVCCQWQAAGYSVADFAAAMRAFGRAGVVDLPLPPENGVVGRIQAALRALRGALTASKQRQRS